MVFPISYFLELNLLAHNGNGRIYAMESSLRENIYEKVREDITFGRLQPGERLIEKDLSDEFKSSRSPIREALRQLQSEGLLSFQRNKGFTVSKLSFNEVEEIFDLRCLLESYAVRLTVQRLTKQQEQLLMNLQKKLRVLAQKDDREGYIHVNGLFHNFFIDNCGNNSLNNILSIIKRRVYRYQYLAVTDSGHFRDYLQQHENIVRACLSGDKIKAESGMRNHLLDVKRMILRYMKKSPFK
jgi:DNA-binding GntR family transcriptional regulator